MSLPITVLVRIWQVSMLSEIADLGSSIVVTSDPDKGSLAYDGDGQFTYTATGGAFGDDTFRVYDHR